MIPGDKTDVDRAMVALGNLARENRIDVRVYNGQALILAADYLRLGHAADAHRLITCLPVRYIKEDLPIDAAANPRLEGAIVGLAAHLVERGHVAAMDAETPTVGVPLGTEIGRA